MGENIINLNVISPRFSDEFPEYYDLVATKKSKNYDPKSENQVQITRNETILLSPLLDRCISDIDTLLRTFNIICGDSSRKGLLRIDWGKGFYFLNRIDITSLIISVYLFALNHVLSTNRFDNISIIELPEASEDFREFPIIIREIGRKRFFSAKDKKWYLLAISTFE